MGTIVVHSDQICVDWSTVEDSTCQDAEENAPEAMMHLIEEGGNDAHPELFYEYSGNGYYIGDEAQICGGWVAVTNYNDYDALAPRGLDTTQIAFEACVDNGGRSFEAIAGLEERAGGSCATWEN